MVLGLLGRTEGGYRSAGAQLVDAALLVTLPRQDAPPLRGPELPLPVLGAAIGLAGADPDVNPFHEAAIGSSILVGLAVALVTLTGGLLAGWPTGVAAGLMFLLTPGTWFAARTAGPEAAQLAAISLLLLAGAQTRPVGRAILGFLGLAAIAGAHHLGLAAVIPWLLAAHFLSPKTPGQAQRPGEIRLGKAGLSWWIALLGGAALLMLWPHLDQDAGKRLAVVVYEPFRTPHPAWLVLGEVRDQAIGRGPNWLQGSLAWLLRVPVLLGALAVVGATAAVRGTGAARPTTPDENGPRRALFALLLLLSLALVAALNGTPYYADTDGFAPAIPCLALLGALGLRATIRWTHAQRPAWPGPAIASAIVVITLGAQVADLTRAYPNEPAWRSPLIGGTAGAAALGMETRADLHLPHEWINWLNQSAPEGARISVQPEPPRARALLDTLRRHGILRADIESAAAYHATHAIVPRMPAQPLYTSLLRWYGEPLLKTEQEGVALLRLYQLQ